MDEIISDLVNDKLESEKYSLKFYFGAIDPIEIEKAKQEALKDIEDEKRD